MNKILCIQVVGLAVVMGGAAARAAEPTANGASGANPSANPFAPASFELASGLDFSAGRYGAKSDTTILDLPLDVKAQLGRLRLQATLPYDYVKGPGEIVGGVVVTSPTGTPIRRWGLGDLTVQGAYLLSHARTGWPAVELAGAVKLPTAKTGIGTGETDYAASVNLYQPVSAKTVLFGSLGYSWLGSPASVALKDGMTGSLGVNYRPSPAQNLGVSLGYRDKVAAGLKAQAAVTPYFTQKLGAHWGVTLYGMGGLTSGSPRIGAGFRLSLIN